MSNLLFIGAFMLIHMTVTFAKLYPCDDNLFGLVCYIENITIGSNENHGSVRFEEARQLIIGFSTIPLFSQDVFANLAEVEYLSLKNGNIASVDFKSDTLNTLQIDSTGLQNLSIAPVPNYNLTTLLINGNHLTVLPKTIRYLYALTILDLSQNHIEYVNLNWFQQMENLQDLDLSRNHIVRMDATSDLHLAKLKSLLVNSNHLSQIPWSPICFPALEQIRLDKNYWNCKWAAAMRSLIWERQITLIVSERTCSEKSEGGLCCYDQIPVALPARHEFPRIEFQPESNRAVFEAEQVTEEPEGTCAEMKDKVRMLQKEKLTLMKKGAEMEKLFLNKLPVLLEMLIYVQDDLDVLKRELSQHRPGEAGVDQQ